jgi:hypothetical protein
MINWRSVKTVFLLFHNTNKKTSHKVRKSICKSHIWLKDFYPQYIKLFYNSIVRRQKHDISEPSISVAVLPKKTHKYLINIWKYVWCHMSLEKYKLQLPAIRMAVVKPCIHGSLYNPSYFGGWGPKDFSSRPDQAKYFMRPHLNRKKKCLWLAHICHPSSKWQKEDHNIGCPGQKAKINQTKTEWRSGWNIKTPA